MLCVANGKIFLQFWHEERAYHPLLNLGAQPVTSSPIAITSNEVHVPQGKKYYVVLRELCNDELSDIITGFKKATENAQVSGFDSVEVHCTNGYLLDEFLRDGVNKRAGYYCGSIKNRAQLIFEVIYAVSSYEVANELDCVFLRLTATTAWLMATQSIFPHGLLTDPTIFVLLIFT